MNKTKCFFSFTTYWYIKLSFSRCNARALLLVLNNILLTFLNGCEPLLDPTKP
jgi:hypothetical protein